jgi:hypothetical protein
MAAYQEAARELNSDQLAAANAARWAAPDTLRDEIRRAPAGDVGAVAPVLRRALDGLCRR